MNLCTAHPRSCITHVSALHAPHHAHCCQSLRTALLATISLLSTSRRPHMGPVGIPWCSSAQKSWSAELAYWVFLEGREGKRKTRPGFRDRQRSPRLALPSIPHSPSKSSARCGQTGWKGINAAPCLRTGDTDLLPFSCRATPHPYTPECFLEQI